MARRRDWGRRARARARIGSALFGQDAGVVAASYGGFLFFQNTEMVSLVDTTERSCGEEKAGPFSLGAIPSKEDGTGWTRLRMGCFFVVHMGKGCLPCVTPTLLFFSSFFSNFYHSLVILSRVADQRLQRVLHGILGQNNNEHCRTTTYLPEGVFPPPPLFFFFFHFCI
ncbi:uncharacterized protein LY79DRAFT_566370 [Colletotrichum navitas]|uniref:Uncharacterized protein n=1 Tax=Colletotrichum navitas TaxID=681940 RepID=A0AAD8PR43_9PEZI|nr:uncharacterized protein LY79DRAFT_566370 [Colletotrichum navitas]KAK1574219.1 hypothetical protein LY79DRAFT_566370 [Colletotrichum navitas]